MIRTSAHAPQRPMVTYTGMGTVGPGPRDCCATKCKTTCGWNVMSSGLVALKTRFAMQRRPMHVKSVNAQTSFRWCSGWKFGEEVPAQVSSSSFDRGSKLRGPSPKTLE
ncbi:hypothetical protein TNCV_2289711 [Trichonephila clavipes]|uniref:Uncharacterized protein n=1 Tax=Trichonephila clavipes TaxID=2585209 RepID=A0A8X6RR80_TRICX|nr:hypothetical protein TNCV_2289711 [Trichonephila clavipes]